MAPHEGEVTLFQDDLQSLFDLAEVLFRVNPSCLIHTRGKDVVSGMAAVLELLVDSSLSPSSSPSLPFLGLMMR